MHNYGDAYAPIIYCKKIINQLFVVRNHSVSRQIPGFSQRSECSRSSRGCSCSAMSSVNSSLSFGCTSRSTNGYITQCYYPQLRAALEKRASYRECRQSPAWLLARMVEKYGLRSEFCIRGFPLEGNIVPMLFFTQASNSLLLQYAISHLRHLNCCDAWRDPYQR